ncbi:MAG: ArsR family transcriptional regulator [Cyanobacteria bacterium REEB65]|nr:ArsR family transcriptional regulator [Cyanobacteria bacterium REEB65]
MKGWFATAPAARSSAQGDRVAKFFRGLADPTRLAVLQTLAEKGELNQTELLALVPVSQGRLSEHLACLKWCHYVETRREGRHMLYAIKDARVLQILALAQGIARDHGDDLAACERIEGEAE